MPTTEPKNSSEQIITTETMPLRIMRNISTLCCPYEAAPNDKLTISHLDNNTQIAYILAESLEQQALLPSFNRHFLLSLVGEYNFLTGSGYTFDGVVDVYSWQSKIDPEKIGENGKSEIEGINIVNKTKMIHIRGLERAVKFHKERIGSGKIRDISLEEAKKIYESLVGHIPKY
jgi:hypothetical protein